MKFNISLHFRLKNGLHQQHLNFNQYIYFEYFIFSTRSIGNVKYFNFDNTKTEVTSLALSFYSGLFAYNGW